MSKIGKYAFDNEAQFQAKRDALTKDHKHTIVQLGHIVEVAPTYDTNGVELTAGQYSNKWHVDVLWELDDTYDDDGNIIKADHPYGWKTYSANVVGVGVHSFFGLKYEDYKF